MGMISRCSSPRENVAIGTTVGNSGEINYEESVAGEFQVVGSMTTLTWYAAIRQSNQPTGQPVTNTFQPAYTQANVAVTQTVAAGRSYPIPVELAGAGAIKATGDAAGTMIVNVKS